MVTLDTAGRRHEDFLFVHEACCMHLQVNYTSAFKKLTKLVSGVFTYLYITGINNGLQLHLPLCFVQSLISDANMFGQTNRLNNLHCFVYFLYAEQHF